VREPAAVLTGVPAAVLPRCFSEQKQIAAKMPLLIQMRRPGGRTGALAQTWTTASLGQVFARGLAAQEAVGKRDIQSGDRRAVRSCDVGGRDRGQGDGRRRGRFFLVCTPPENRASCPKETRASARLPISMSRERSKVHIQPSGDRWTRLSLISDYLSLVNEGDVRSCARKTSITGCSGRR